MPDLSERGAVFMLQLWNSPAVRYLRDCVGMYFDKQVPQTAASLSYFLLLTVFPLLICVNAFLGLLNLDVFQVLSYLEGFLPAEGMEVIRSYLSYISGGQSGGLLAAGLIMAFTSSSAAFRTLMRALARIYDEPPRRGIWSMILSILFPLGLLLTIYLSIGVIVTGDWLLGILAQEFHLRQVLALWQSLRFLLLFLVFFLFILTMSRLAMPRNTRRAPLVVGSTLSAVTLVAASILFSWFISLSTRYSLVYGSLMSIVVLMVWLYLCGIVLLLGNIVSRVWYKRHKASTYISRGNKDRL